MRTFHLLGQISFHLARRNAAISLDCSDQGHTSGYKTGNQSTPR